MHQSNSAIPNQEELDLSRRFSDFRFAPNRVIVSILVILFFIDFVCILYASRLPSIEGNIHTLDNQLVFVNNGSRHTINAISGLPDEWVSLTTEDLIEEPDYLNEYASYNAFFNKQSILSKHMLDAEVAFKTIEGHIINAKIIHQPWYQLPLMFWVQLIAANLAIMIGAWLWSFRQNDHAAKQYFMSAIFIALCIFPAAIYSTRTLAIPGDIFHLLSVLDHLGLYLFCAAMLSLNWLFPYPLGALNLPFYLYISFFMLWIANTFQLLPNFDISIRGVAVLTLSGVIAMVLTHWRRNRTQPHYLIMIKWFSLATIAGPSLFLCVIFLPPLFNVQPFISQGFAFVAFLIIYLSMAIAVSRYKLFEYERWWSESLIWLFFGLLVIGMDLLIIFILDLSFQQASWFALAITGWLYFPLRQVILNKLLLKNDQGLRTHFPFVVSVIAGSANHDQLILGLEHCLIKIFDPLHIERSDQSCDRLQLAYDGSRITIPLPEQSNNIEIIYADRGKRLFNSYDYKTAKALVDLFKHAMIAQKAKEDGMHTERRRIRQDMHDSLGGYLLSIMHRKVDPQSALLARYAWNELRDILSALDERMSPLSVELLRWKSTLEKLVSSDKIIFNFFIDESVLNSEIELSGFQRLNLGQILREGVTNAFRHAQPSLISVYCEHQDSSLLCTIKNNGHVVSPELWAAGRGLRHIKNRTVQLNGSVDWQLTESACLVMTLKIPLGNTNAEIATQAPSYLKLK